MVYDVVVVGAGLSGLQCARLLGLSGLRVLLVDRKASLVDRIQTTGIFVRKTWEDFPLPEEQLGKPIRRVTLYSPKGRTLRLN
ncbi:MAG: FAD-dependent monooxygenase, partial [Thermoanaerobaculia bacterium]